MPPEPEIIKKHVKRGVTVWADRRYLDSLVKAGIGEPEVFVNRYADNLIDDVTKSKITSLTVNLGDRPFRVAAKEYLPRGGAGWLKNLFRPSKARIELLISTRLLALGIPCPEPVAAVEIRWFRFLKKAYLFSEELTDSSSLLELMDNRGYQQLKRRQLNGVIRAIAETVATAHVNGFFHGDLNASHIILQEWNQDEPSIYLLDFENSKIRSSSKMKYMIKDIGRLEKSASYFVNSRERLRFIKYYLAKIDNASDLRALLKKVQAEVIKRTK